MTKMLNLTTQPPLSLYIHTPWCVKKCPYCDFNSHTMKSDVPERTYLRAIITDLEKDLHRVWGRRVQSIFIGGGTPSLFSPEFYEQLISDLRARLMITAQVEITMEANPGAVERDRFSEFRAAGINRLSIGAQSFNDAHLSELGRIHQSSDAISAVEAARTAGFDNVNIDLMFGLPTQSVEQASQDIDRLLALQPAHISYYQLTLEPNTLFYQQPPQLPDDDLCWTMQTMAQQRFQQAGYTQYEVSAYAQNNLQCVHNLNYWQFGDYLGIGAGAHSKLTDVNARQIIRLLKEKHPDSYLRKVAEGNGTIQEEVVDRHELPIEFMINALRLIDGFDSGLFSERTGLPISVIESPLKQAEDRGLIQWTIDRIKPTELGFKFLNDLQAMFLPDSE